MRYRVYKSDQRGITDYGWLRSYHSFSFGGFYDPDLMHFGMLRVFNDDEMLPGKGFGAHPHHNMEIVSIPIGGALLHADDTGQSSTIKAGDVQVMSAGSGIVHSEFNASQHDVVRFLQVWVFPSGHNITPRYQQKSFSFKERINQFQTVVAPDNDQALGINQQSWFTLFNPSEDYQADYNFKQLNNGLYIYVIDGSIVAESQIINTGDAIGFWQCEQVNIKAKLKSQLLLIEVPMT